MKNYFSYSDQDAAMMVRWVKEERNMLALLEKKGYAVPADFEAVLKIAAELEFFSDQFDILVRLMEAHRPTTGETEASDGWYDWEGANNFANRHEED